MSIAPVSVVTPIQSTSSVFRVIFGWLINRETEVFGGWMLFGLLVSMFGVVALTVSTELVLSTFSMPEFVQNLASLSWP